MRQAVLWTIVLALSAGCNLSGDNSSTGDPAAMTKRQEDLKRNIEFHLREQLGGRSVTVGPIEDSDVPGFDRSTFSVGRETYPVLVDEDDSHVLLLAMEPLANLSAEEMAERRAVESREANAEADALSMVLTAEAANLPSRGNPTAPVTIVEFSDFECPYCRRGFDTIEQLLEKRGSDVRLVYMHFPLNNHPWAKPSAIAATCAAEQDEAAFWTLHDYYFRNQDAIEVDNVVAKSREALTGSGLGLAEWEACATQEDSEAYQSAVAAVDAQMALGMRSGVTGTPGFFVNGTFLNGAQPLEAFEAAIDAAMARL